MGKLLILPIFFCILMTAQKASCRAFSLNDVLYCNVNGVNKTGTTDELAFAIGENKHDGKRDLYVQETSYSNACWKANEMIYCQWGMNNLLVIGGEVKELRGDGKVCFYLTGSMHYEIYRNTPLRCTLSCQ